MEKKLPPEALRALQEAEQRREEQKAIKKKPKEFGGPKGAEPSRYGDWIVKGRAIDF